MDDDRHYTCEMLAEGIAHGSVHTIERRHLKMWRVFVSWDFSSLESGPNDRQGSTCLKQYEDQSIRLLNCTVAIDETWWRSYEPECKSKNYWKTLVRLNMSIKKTLLSKSFKLFQIKVHSNTENPTMKSDYQNQRWHLKNEEIS